jgi:hypothetical protein
MAKMKVLERLVDSNNRKMNSSAIKRGSEEWRTFNSVLQQAKKRNSVKALVSLNRFPNSGVRALLFYHDCKTN